MIKNKIKRQNILSSVFFRLFMIMFLVLIPINFALVFYSGYLFRNVEQQIYTNNENLLKQYINQIDNTLEQVNKVLYRLFEDEKSYILRSGGVTEENEIKWYLAYADLKKNYEEWLWDYPLIDGFFSYYIYEESTCYVVKSTNTSSSAGINGKVLNLIQKKLKQAEDQNDTYRGVVWETVKIDGGYYIWLIQKKGNFYCGAWVNLDNVLKEWNLNADEESFYYFIDIQNKPFTAQEFTSDNDIAVSVKSEKSEVSLVQGFYNSNIISSMPKMVIILFIIALLSLGVIPILVMVTRRYILKPINQLLKGMEIAEKGNLEYHIPTTNSNGEFVKINHSFNKMIEEIHILKIDAYETQIEKQKIQMRYLSQQIQPHFILNTLNILYSYEPDDFPLIQEMILCLAKYFRYIVNANDEFVQLEKELDHIRNYFAIQHARYPKLFDYYVEAEDGLQNMLIPPLIIQNFAENAVKHSISMDYKVNIYVLVEKKDKDKIRIRIADTGKGLSKETLEAIERFCSTKNPQLELGIGIQNAIERLHILYNGIPNIEFYNSEMGGATIDIIMPRLKKEDIKEGQYNDDFVS